MKCFRFASLPIALALTALVKGEFIRSCTEEKTIALTFDDGPFKYTRKLVDYFVDQHNDVKVTFFTVGKFHYPFGVDTDEYQEAMKKAHDNGLQIASHTFMHKISPIAEEFKDSLDKQDEFIEKVTGDKPRYFRAPKGNCEEQCLQNLDDWGYRVIQWDTDTNDWDLETSGTAEKRVEDSVNFLKKEFEKEKDSYLILMHDTEEYTVEQIAPWIIEKSGMKEKGYRFVTVAECLGDKDGMYRSGKTFGTTTVPGNSTIIDNGNNNSTIKAENVTETVRADESMKQQLTSGAYMNTPLTYLCLTLMTALFYTMF